VVLEVNFGGGGRGGGVCCVGEVTTVPSAIFALCEVSAPTNMRT